jgi:adenine-specific DNA-methyltransferase
MDKKIELGQVFTLPSVSKLMVSLIKDEVKPEDRVLDPCIGPNTFLNDFEKFNLNPNMVGIELDTDLISPLTKKFYKKTKRELIIGNFFDYPTDEKFDFIIMNPPYVRQEHLGDSKNNKKQIINFFKYKIPKKSNLYIYFILKAFLHLKEGGRLIAIVYDSWLYSAFGENFKELLVRNCSINKIIHFRSKAFDNADVGATIIELTKEKRKNSKFHYYNYDNPASIETDKSLKLTNPTLFNISDIHSFQKGNTVDINFDTNFFTIIKEVSEHTINRGTNAIVNEFFIFKDKQYPNLKEIIKSVASIKKMTVNKEFKYLLYANGQKLPKALEKYLLTIKERVISEPDKYKNLFSKITSDPSWYKINLAKPGNIIFNYYIRDNIDFIFNPHEILSSDNFYNLSVKDKIFANFAILNSSFTKLAILKHSRSQGKGLFKIQLYEFLKVPIININYLSIETINKLTELGQKLANCFRNNKENILSEIDVILINEYNQYNEANIGLHTLYEALNNIRQGKIHVQTLV